MLKWQQEYRDRLMALSSENLFDEMLYAQVPDDWDGAFTNQGLWRSKESTKQIRDRYIRNARLAELMTPELASLLDGLIALAKSTDVQVPVLLRGPMLRMIDDAREQAKRIREALALEASDEG